VSGHSVLIAVANSFPGRRLEDFPEMVEDHNRAVADLEVHLVKYLKGGRLANKRPVLRKGGFLGMGGEKKDAIEYLSKEIKFLRDRIDSKRQAIDSLLRQERRARKGGQPTQRVEGENYGGCPPQPSDGAELVRFCDVQNYHRSSPHSPVAQGKAEGAARCSTSLRSYAT
jgi:hypothetical protein